MAHRRVKFEDTEWDVWDVRPEVRPHNLGSDLQDGWLCFQSGMERRRLFPIPEHWDELGESELRTLFEQAQEVAPTRSPGRATPADAYRAVSMHRDQAAD